MTRNQLLVVLAVLLTIPLSCSDAGSEKRAGEAKTALLPAHNNIREYLIAAADQITNDSSDDHSLAQWENIKPRRYQQFLEMMGIEHLVKAKRTDLNITVTGTVRKRGYRIEKLYFESLPGLFVRANLYIPDSIREPRPAMLYVSGHTPDQKGSYQGHPRKFAELGFVCMITETIQFGEVRGEHWGCYAKGWFNWYSRGYNPGGVELWNSIRAIDLLSQRPEVNPEKIGVTGISGGGSQSWYIAAADQRIKAAAPVCGAGTLQDHVLNRTLDGHCDCMMPLNTFQQDFKNIGALIAPRPLLIAQADRDGMYKIEAVRQLESQVKKTYALYGKPQNVSLIETPGGHSYHRLSRENIFSFFLEHLMDKKRSPAQAGDIDTAVINNASPDELKVYVDGPPQHDRTTTIQDSFIPLATAPEISSKNQLLAFRDSVKAFLNEKTFGAFPKEDPAFEQRSEFKSNDSENSGNYVYSFISEPGWRLKVDIHWKNDPAAKKPLLIVLRNYNEERWTAESFISGLEEDWNIAYFEARGIGETGWDPGLQWHIRRAAAWTGRTIASMQVYDVLRCIRFCRTLPNVNAEAIGIAAQKEMGVVALYSALMDGRCKKVIVKDPPSSQDEASSPDGKGAAIEMLNCLKIIDVNRLPALLLPTQTEFRGVVPATYQWSQQVIARFEK